MAPRRVSLLLRATGRRRSSLSMGSWQVIITIQLQLLAPGNQWCRPRGEGHALQTWKGMPLLAKYCDLGMWARQPLPLGIQSRSAHISILPKFLEKLAHFSLLVTPNLERPGKGGWSQAGQQMWHKPWFVTFADFHWSHCSYQVTGPGRWVHHLIIDRCSRTETTVKHSKK